MFTHITSNTDVKKDCASHCEKAYPKSTASSNLEDEPVPCTTAKIIDSLVTDLALACAYIQNEQHGCTYIVFKYYEKAVYWMYRIPVYKPVPFFDINVMDLSSKLKHELAELKKSDPMMFWYVVKVAVAHIFENVNFEYFHRSVMRFLKIRFVP
jgi:hypothetical protein